MLLAALSLAFARPPSIDEPHRTGASSGRDAAVVIGIEDYASLGAVPHAAADAASVRDLLVYSRGVPDSNVQLLGNDATPSQIRSALEQAARKVGPTGVLWVYFAGHGGVEGGQRMLLTNDGGVSLADVHAVHDGAMFLWVDASYSGTGRSGEALPGSPFSLPSVVDPPAQHVEWFAAAPDEVAGSLDVAKHGAFTWFGVGALRGWADGEVDGLRNGQITLDEARAYVSRGLGEAGLRGQHPVSSGEMSGALTFGKEPGPADIPAALTPDPEPEVDPKQKDRKPPRLVQRGPQLSFGVGTSFGIGPRASAGYIGYMPDGIEVSFQTANGFQVGPTFRLGLRPTAGVEIGGTFWLMFGPQIESINYYTDEDDDEPDVSDRDDGEPYWEGGLYGHFFLTDTKTRPFLAVSTTYWKGYGWEDWDPGSFALAEQDDDLSEDFAPQWQIILGVGAGLELEMAKGFDFVIRPTVDIPLIGVNRNTVTTGDDTPFEIPGRPITGFHVLMTLQGRRVLR